MREPWCLTTDTLDGVMLCNPQDQYVGRSLIDYGEFSRHEVTLLSHFLPVGGGFVDIGANIGALTVPFGRLVGPTGWGVAVEPQRTVFMMLAGNCAIHQLDHVLPVQAAVGDALVVAAGGVMQIPRLDPRRTNNFGGLEITQAFGVTDTVWATTLPGLLDACAPPGRVPDLIKMDVEGMEPDILTGGMDWLRQHQPVLYVENDRSDDAKRRVLGLLHQAGYECWWHTPPLFNPTNMKQQPDLHQWSNIVSLNVLATKPGLATPELRERFRLEPTVEGQG